MDRRHIRYTQSWVKEQQKSLEKPRPSPSLGWSTMNTDLEYIEYQQNNTNECCRPPGIVVVIIEHLQTEQSRRNLNDLSSAVRYCNQHILEHGLTWVCVYVSTVEQSHVKSLQIYSLSALFNYQQQYQFNDRTWKKVYTRINRIWRIQLWKLHLIRFIETSYKKVSENRMIRVLTRQLSPPEPFMW